MYILIISILLILLHAIYIIFGYYYTKINNKHFGKNTNFKKYKIEHIVCFKNESNFIQKKLYNIYNWKTNHDLHHTFVNDNSSDDTLQLLNKFKDSNTSLINNTVSIGKNQAQIKAVGQSNSDLVLFTDANVFLENDAVDKLVQEFNEDTGGVTGNVKITTDLTKQDFSGQYWEVEKKIKEFQSIFGSVIGFDGGFYCIKRENYYLKRENELSDFESAFLIFENQKRTRYVKDAIALELERRTLINSFKSRVRASNRIFWSFFRISKYFRKLHPMVIFHFFFHKIVRYLACILLVLSFPFIIGMLLQLTTLILFVLLLPWLWRLIFECTALCVGGLIALTGKEYRTWSHTKL